MCPDFAAEHADISTGGIGAFNDWTLTIVRTDIGRELMDGMLARRLDRDPPRRRRPRRHRARCTSSRRSRASAGPSSRSTRPASCRRPQLARATRGSPSGGGPAAPAHRRRAASPTPTTADRHRARARAGERQRARRRDARHLHARSAGARGELDAASRRVRRRSRCGSPRTARTIPPRCSRWSPSVLSHLRVQGDRAGERAVGVGAELVNSPSAPESHVWPPGSGVGTAHCARPRTALGVKPEPWTTTSSPSVYGPARHGRCVGRRRDRGRVEAERRRRSRPAGRRSTAPRMHARADRVGAVHRCPAMMTTPSEYVAARGGPAATCRPHRWRRR